MRYFRSGLLAAALILPATAQSAKFINVEVISQSRHLSKLGKKGTEKVLPETIQIRMPVSLAKAFLKGLEENEIKVNGESKQGIKVDQLIELLNSSKPGDLLLEIKTSNGDLVKVTLE
ncbi:MAG: hypothetical protein LBB40_02905 [Holophagales bacterium]|jgi:hypothetical protein|nr:hypothetical protein [Holophagales bacterium]